MKQIDLFELLGIKRAVEIPKYMSKSAKLRKLNELKDRLKPLVPGTKSIEYTKYDEPVLLISPIDLEQFILIYKMYNGVHRFQLILINDGDVLTIADIQVLEESEFGKGYGTFLVQTTI